MFTVSQSCFLFALLALHSARSETSPASSQTSDPPPVPNPPIQVPLDKWQTSVFISFRNFNQSRSDAATSTFSEALMAVSASPSSDIKAAATTASSVFFDGVFSLGSSSCAHPGDRPCIADLLEINLREAVCGLHQHWMVDEFQSLKPGDEGYQIGLNLHGTFEEDAVDTIDALNELSFRGWRAPSPDPEHLPFDDLLAARASPRFLVLGDSHAAAWSMLRHCSGVASPASPASAASPSVASSVIIHHVCSRNGATMLGLNNDRGSVWENGVEIWSARSVFEQALSRHTQFSDGGVILHVGEIDSAILVHSRAARNGETITDGALLAVSRFSDFVSDVVRPYFRPGAVEVDACAARPRIYVVPVVVLRQVTRDDGAGSDVPWEDQVAVARIINSGLRAIAGEQGWVVLSHPFAPGAGGDAADNGFIEPSGALLGEDGAHFKLSLVWSWLNQALKEAVDSNSHACADDI